MEDNRGRATELASNLALLRKNHGYSQEKLAESLNISRQSVSKWEAGVNCPELDKLMQLASLYGVTIDALLYNNLSEGKPEAAQDYMSKDEPQIKEPQVKESQIKESQIKDPQIKESQIKESQKEEMQNDKLQTNKLQSEALRPFWKRFIVVGLAAILINLLLYKPLIDRFGAYGLAVIGILYLLTTAITMFLFHDRWSEVLSVKTIETGELKGIILFWLGVTLITSVAAGISTRIQGISVKEQSGVLQSIYEGVPFYVGLILMIFYTLCCLVLSLGYLRYLFGSSPNKWLFLIVSSILLTCIQPQPNTQTLMASILFYGASVYIIYKTGNLLYPIAFHIIQACINAGTIFLMQNTTMDQSLKYLPALTCAGITLLAALAPLFLKMGIRRMSSFQNQMHRHSLTGLMFSVLMLCLTVYFCLESRSPVFAIHSSIQGMPAEGNDFSETLVIPGTGEYQFDWDIDMSYGILYYEILDEDNNIVNWSTASEGYGNGLCHYKKGTYDFNIKFLITGEEVREFLPPEQAQEWLSKHAEEQAVTLDVEYKFTVYEYPSL